MKWTPPTNKKRARRMDRKRIEVLNRYGWWCCYCHKPLTLLSILGKDALWWSCQDILLPMTLEHVTPESLGGTRDVENLRPCCWTCNTKSLERPHTPSGSRHLQAEQELEHDGKRYVRRGKRWVEKGEVDDE